MKLYNYFYIVLGTLSLILGCIGIVLPLLPTTPFLLLSGACYYRGSHKMYEYLINHKVFGKYIDDYLNKGGIHIRAKIVALTALWISMMSCILLFHLSVLIEASLLLIAVLVTYHISSKKTLRN